MYRDHKANNRTTHRRMAMATTALLASCVFLQCIMNLLLTVVHIGNNNNNNNTLSSSTSVRSVTFHEPPGPQPTKLLQEQQWRTGVRRLASDTTIATATLSTTVASSALEPLDCSVVLHEPFDLVAFPSHPSAATGGYETDLEEQWRVSILRAKEGVRDIAQESRIVITVGGVHDVFTIDSMLVPSHVQVHNFDSNWIRLQQVCHEQLGDRISLYHTEILALDKLTQSRNWMNASHINTSQVNVKPSVELLQMGSMHDVNSVFSGAAHLVRERMIKHVIWRVSVHDDQSIVSSETALHSLFKAGYQLVGQDRDGQLRDVPWLHESMRVQHLIDSATKHSNKELSVWFRIPNDPETTQLTKTRPIVVRDCPPINCRKYVIDAKAKRLALMDPNQFADAQSLQQLVSPRNQQNLSAFWISLHRSNDDPENWRIKASGRHHKTKKEVVWRKILGEAPQGSRVIDIGSDIGYFSLLSLSMGATVDAFEPNEVNNLRLCESLALNDVQLPASVASTSTSSFQSRIRIRSIGLSDQTEMLPYFEVHRPPGRSRYVPPESELYRDRAFFSERPVTTLDRFAHRQGWLDPFVNLTTTVELVAIATPGVEHRVISGARYFFKEKLANNILLECLVTSKQERSNSRMALLALIDAGYHVHGWGGWEGPRELLYTERLLLRRDDPNRSIRNLLDAAVREKSNVLHVWFKAPPPATAA